MRRKSKQNILICAAAKGSLWTRLSFLVMGAGGIRYKQYMRGLLYLLSQIGFILFFRNFALQYLTKFTEILKGKVFEEKGESNLGEKIYQSTDVLLIADAAGTHYDKRQTSPDTTFCSSTN